MFFGQQKSYRRKFLTVILLGIILLTEIRADLAPKEDDDDSNNDKIDLEQKPSENEKEAEQPKMSMGFVHAFIASFSVIIVSEIGDKTFFIAAIMSMVRLK